jgi:dienelactone hydrolase
MEKHTMSSIPYIHVEPEIAQVDEKVTIILENLQPEQIVTMQASSIDDNGIQWRSSATYQANAAGRVDISTQPPITGTYTEVDAMGLYWSMYPQVPQQQQSPFAKTTLNPIKTQLTLEIARRPVAEIIHERHFLAPNISKMPITHENIIGTFFQIDSQKPQPCVILLNGSSGASRELDAALLAAHGYHTLALTYFGQRNQSQELQEIPLEYLKNTLQWLQEIPCVKRNAIAVMGISKGGELALLAATLFPEITVVISYATSAFVHQGLGTPMQGDERGSSSWTYQGKQIPFLPYRPSSAYIRYVNKQRNAGRPVACLNGYLDSLQNRVIMEKAMIPVEKIHAPILLISGEDDKMWPSTLFSDMIEKRLNEHNHPYPHQHLYYAYAGHRIGYPYLPTTIDWARGYTYGGTPSGNAHATEHSWQTVLTFLDEHLRKQQH